MKAVVSRKFRFLAPLLVIVYSGCSGGENAGPSAAAAIEANTPSTLTAVAGSAVTPPPSVIVRDLDGNPFPGASVTFNVTAGGGTIAATSAVTDASGVASVGTWTLGKTAGPNTLTATSGSLSVTFNATGTVGPTALLTISAGENQSAAAGSAVATPPAVLVQDANGNAKSGVTVTFGVGQGGGSVTGATATSNTSGIATVGSWTLGTSAGANTLVASAAGAPPVTFHATAVVTSKCDIRVAHALGSSTSGALESDDCKFSDGSLVDFFATTLPSANAYLFREIASFDAYLDLALADGTVIAENDDVSEDDSTSAIKALLPAGNYLLGASSYGPGITGSYTVSSQLTSTDNTNCEVVFVMKGVTTSQNINSSDCLRSQPSDPPINADAFYILLRAGQTVTIDMTSPIFDAYLELVRISGASVAQNDNKDATTKDARITFTASVTDYYAIVARTAAGSQSGPYTLSIQ